LILRKTVEIVATICHTLRLKCTQFDCGRDFAPDSDGELTALLETP